jgi:hypothetical protein
MSTVNFESKMKALGNEKLTLQNRQERLQVAREELYRQLAVNEAELRVTNMSLEALKNFIAMCAVAQAIPLL